MRKACDAVATLSRFSLVEQALLRPDGIVASARKEAAVRGFALAGDITLLELDPRRPGRHIVKRHAGRRRKRPDRRHRASRQPPAGSRRRAFFRRTPGGWRFDDCFGIDAQRRSGFHGQRRRRPAAARRVVRVRPRAIERFCRADRSASRPTCATTGSMMIRSSFTARSATSRRRYTRLRFAKTKKLRSRRIHRET